MPTITVYDIPPDLYDRLKAAARTHRRTISGEVIDCIKQRVGAHKVDPEEMLIKARRLRANILACPVTDDEITAAKKRGRL